MSTQEIQGLRSSGLWWQLPLEERKERVCAELLAIFAEVLAEPLGPEILQRRFSSLGIDSLDAFDVESSFEDRTGMSLDAAQLLADKSVEEVIDALLANDALRTAEAGASSRKDFSV